MKNLILSVALLLAANFTFGQTLEKGNLLGLHVMDVTLDPNVTMNQFKAFFIDKWAPEFEKNFKGSKVLLLKGIRGDNENSFATITFFESEKKRNKFWKDDGSPTKLGIASMEKMGPTLTELEKLGAWTSTYTDWIIQK